MPFRGLLVWPVLNLLLLNAITGAAVADDANSLGFIKGYSWGWVGTRGSYEAPEATESMQRLAETGTEWTCLAFSTTMATAETPDFGWAEKNPRMVTDDEIRRAIDLARQQGMKVILKPVVNCRDQTWRAWIKFFRPTTQEKQAQGITGELDPWGPEPVMREGMVKDLKKWDVWWGNFTAFVVHYAKIAEEKQVPLFCLGCEMNSTEEFEQKWRELIAQVRKVYTGKITYNVNHGRESQLPWWDAVDLISISGYYEVPPPGGQSLKEAVQHTTPKEQIVERLQSVKQQLVKVHTQTGKPILFIETGVTSVRGCARYPWSHPNAFMEQPVDQQEQANYYQAMFEVFWDEPWFRGFCWWDWPARLYDKSHADKHPGFCVYGKQAEEVLRKWYAKPSK